jgi:hypothetical protein
MGMCHCILEVCNFLFALRFRGDFGVELLNNIETVKTLGILRDGLNAFCFIRWPQGEECYGLNMKYPSQAQMLKTWPPGRA